METQPIEFKTSTQATAPVAVPLVACAALYIGAVACGVAMCIWTNKDRRSQKPDDTKNTSRDNIASHVEQQHGIQFVSSKACRKSMTIYGG